MDNSPARRGKSARESDVGKAEEGCEESLVERGQTAAMPTGEEPYRLGASLLTGGGQLTMVEIS
jgi:hypothetical protein